MKKNDFLVLKIESTDKNGCGIAHTEDGIVVFVRNACKGDLIKAKIIKITKSYAVAIIDTIIEPSVNRVSDGCYVSSKCGGCVFQHINYETESVFKRESIDSVLERIAKTDLRVSAYHPAKSTTRYRNKAIYPVAPDSNGKAISGFYAQMSHRIIEHNDCLIGNDKFSQIKDSIIEYVNKNNISPYDEIKKSGVLRGIYLRASDSGCVLLTLILFTDKFINDNVEKDFVDYILKNHTEICSVVININKKDSNGVLGKSWRTLYGDGYLYDTLCGKDFRVSPASFYQVNHDQTEVLYGIAKRFANLNPGDKLIDLYCGTGSVGICISEKTTKLFGVEIVQEAVIDASYNAAKNGIDAEFICLDAEKALDDERLLQIKPDVITIDPPRKGCGIEAAKKIASLGAKRIVYISCDPATLARDIFEFEKCGYKAVCAEGVDMFPRTGHVECCVLLYRK